MFSSCTRKHTIQQQHTAVLAVSDEGYGHETSVSILIVVCDWSCSVVLDRQGTTAPAAVTAAMAGVALAAVAAAAAAAAAPMSFISSS